MNSRDSDGTIEQDIAFVMHLHSERLDSIKSMLEPVRDYVSGAWELSPHSEDADSWRARVYKLVQSLLDAVNAVLSEHSEDLPIRIDAPLTIEAVFDNKNRLTDLLNLPEAERAHLPYILERIRETASIYSPSGNLRIKKEQKRRVFGIASDAEKLIAHWYLLRAEEFIAEMREQTKSLQSYYRTTLSPETEAKPIMAREILRRAVQDQEEYALVSQVKLEPINELGSSEVEGDVTQLTRCLANIINNAIKYTYKSAHTQVWIKILAVNEPSNVVFSVESWGTPISAEEIDSGKLLKFGIRGESANKSGKLGTGIGLADSRVILKNHGGSLNITSVPSRVDSASSKRISAANVTTVVIRLPRRHKR